MSKEQWVDYNFDTCPSCSGSLKVLTKSTKEDWFFDGDIVECENENNGCDAKDLQLSADEEGMYINGEW